MFTNIYDKITLKNSKKIAGSSKLKLRGNRPGSFSPTELQLACTWLYRRENVHKTHSNHQGKEEVEGCADSPPVTWALSSQVSRPALAAGCSGLCPAAPCWSLWLTVARQTPVIIHRQSSPWGMEHFPFILHLVFLRGKLTIHDPSLVCLHSLTCH